MDSFRTCQDKVPQARTVGNGAIEQKGIRLTGRALIFLDESETNAQGRLRSKTYGTKIIKRALHQSERALRKLSVAVEVKLRVRGFDFHDA